VLDGFADAAGPGSVTVAAGAMPSNRRAAGFAPTFPAHTWYPPLIAIDHELTRHFAASSTRIIGCTELRSTARRWPTFDVPLDPSES
jgi:hypothetical protein